ncbi:MAG: HEAT repeat domain-containing protein [Caldilineaceae bacterium]
MEQTNGFSDNEYRTVLNLLNAFGDRSSSKLYDEILGEIKNLDRQSTTSQLQQLLKHPNQNLRSRAGEVLLQIDTQQSLALVLTLLKDPVEHVRENICDWLCGYGDYRAVDTLIEVLLYDSSSDARFNAAVALANIGDKRAIPVLERVVQNDFGEDFQGITVSSVAEQAIEQIRNPPQ